MPLLKIKVAESGVVGVDTVDTGERLLNPSENARLQLIEDREARRAAAEDAGREAGPDDSQALVEKGVGEKPPVANRAPNSDVVSTERVQAARRAAPVDPEELSIARMVEAELGPDPDAPADTTVADVRRAAAEEAQKEAEENTPTTAPKPDPVVIEVGSTACPVCTKKAKTPSGLSSHMKHKHPNIEIQKVQG